MSDCLWNFFDKNAYIIELIAAAILNLSVCKKRKHFSLIASAGAAILLLISHCVNTYFDYKIPEPLFSQLIYWGILLSGVFPYVRACMDGSLSHTIYVALCSSATQHLVFEFRGLWIGALPHIIAFLLYIILFISGYTLMYFLIIRHLRIQDENEITMADVKPMAVIIVSVLGLTILNSIAATTIESKILFCCADALYFIYVFWGQVHERQKLRVQRELDTTKSILMLQQKQYHLTQENIDTINRKCHDMRHQIRTLLYNETSISEIEHAITIYDTALQTGNAALDTILMEKGLFCKTHGVAWTCMADGSKLDFIEPEDIFSIMGNAIENAIYAVSNLENPEQRVINLRLYYQDSFIIIQVQNYYAGELRFKDGLPRTSKEDERYHGFGLKSIRYSVEKYHGYMTIHTDNQIFTLQLTIPTPQ